MIDSLEELLMSNSASLFILEKRKIQSILALKLVAAQ